MTARSLRISPTLELPVDAATDTRGILAKKGSGKSNAAVVLAEEMFDAGIPWVAIDPKGDWHGVRSSSDGTKPGLAVAVFGGKHGCEVPLTADSGAQFADLILGDDDRGYLTCVLDVSQFTITEQRRFLLAFGDRLYRQKDEEGVLHLFLEEAHEYLPQQVPRESTQLVSTWQRIVKLGRTKGLGITLVSQRSAALNKDVLTQVDELVVLRTMSPQDRAVVKAWLDVHVGVTEVINTLHELAKGEAWMWAPDRFEAPVRFQFRRRRTFDSGATPEVGKVRRAPATLADVDLSAIKEQMADAIERSKADDPKELRRRIAQLERDLTAARAATPPPEVEEVEVVPAGFHEALDRVEGRIRAIDEALDGLIALRHLRQAVAAVDRPGRAERKTPTPPANRQRDREDIPARDRPARPSAPATVDTDLPKGELRILTAVAQYRHGVTREQLTVLTGYKRSSRDTYIQRLSTRGHVTTGARIRVTDAGVAALGPNFEPLPTGAALREHWLRTLPEGERRILALLIETHPYGVPRDELSEITGYKRSSRDTYLQRLRSRQLVITDDGDPRAADVLFEGGR